MATTKPGRISLVFTEEDHAYIKAMARAMGRTMTAYITDLIHADMEAHQDTYKEVVAMQKRLGAGDD